jgi:hypothetical protein
MSAGNPNANQIMEVFGPGLGAIMLAQQNRLGVQRQQADTASTVQQTNQNAQLFPEKIKEAGLMNEGKSLSRLLC